MHFYPPHFGNFPPSPIIRTSPFIRKVRVESMVDPEGCRLFRYQTFRPGTFRYRHFGTRHFGTGDISVRGHFSTWDILVPSSKWDISVRGHFGPWDISVRGHFGTRDISVLRHFGTRDISAPSNDSLIAFETFCVWNLDWAPAESSLWKEAPLRWIAG